MFQIEVWKSQEYFVYFKIFKPISWGKRPAERRSRFIQRFLRSNRVENGRFFVKPAVFVIDSF